MFNAASGGMVGANNSGPAAIEGGATTVVAGPYRAAGVTVARPGSATGNSGKYLGQVGLTRSHKGESARRGPNGVDLLAGAPVPQAAGEPGKADRDQTEHDQGGGNGHAAGLRPASAASEDGREMESVHGIPLRPPLTILLVVSDRPDFRRRISETGPPGGGAALPGRNRRYRRSHPRCSRARRYNRRRPQMR